MIQRAYILASAVLLTIGCSEYQISTDPRMSGQPNPKDLENPTQQDRIVQVTTPQVDVLWVIDNSCSMQDEQDALTAAFPAFMDFFLGSGLDYHVGVTSTDIDKPATAGLLEEAGGVKWLDPDTQNPTQVFTTMASLGTGGSSSESGIGAAYYALELKKDGANAGFLREAASMHAIVISDEKDFTPANVISKVEFIDYLSNLKSDPDMTTWSSIVNCPDGAPTCQLGTPLGESAGVQYIDVTLAVGGILWEIHKGDWPGVLEALGVQAAGLKREYFLSQLPLPGSIIVYVVIDDTRYDFVEGKDWTYDAKRNSITFETYVPPALSQVFLEYTILAAYQEH